MVLVTTSVGPRASRAAPPLRPATAGPMQLVPAVRLSASHPAWQSGPLPSAHWELSFDLSLAPNSDVEVDLGTLSRKLVFSRAARGAPTLRLGARTYALGLRAGWPQLAGGPHVEATATRRAALSIDGRSIPVGRTAGARAPIAVLLVRGQARLGAVILSASGDRPSLLVHRLAELHARVVPGSLLLGADRADGLYFLTTWTSGFLPGALWDAAALYPGDALFSRWAMQATVRHFGLESSPTHDVGFMYGQSSLAAWRARCRGQVPQPVICGRLVGSVLAAARELVALSRTNPGAGTIPTNATSPVGETIIDSMMNIGILTWASRYTHERGFARLASHQAHVIGSLLVRPDGSTIQAVHFARSTGRIVFLGTHQGLSANSTWSRGQGWGLYGFAQTAIDLHDAGLLAVAQRLGRYVARHLPASQVPPWDYAAGPHAPVDISAAMITAAGMFRLSAACQRMPGVCSDPFQWSALGRAMLAAALTHASGRPPIGFLGSQVLTYGRRTCCNGAELIFGVTYALEALRLEHMVR